MTLERDILSAIRLALGRMDGVVLWRNHVGVVRQPDGSVQPFGLVRGSADLIGIVAMGNGADSNGDRWGIGRFIALEVKGERGRLSVDQKAFLALVRKMGGFAACVRSTADAVAAVERCRKGECE